jgi:hypothetical protein
MTNAKDGNEDARTQKYEWTTWQRNLMQLRALAQGVSILLGVGLTVFLAYKEQYFDALCGLALTIAGGSHDQLKRIRMGLQGFSAEWGRRERLHPARRRR